MTDNDDRSGGMRPGEQPTEATQRGASEYNESGEAQITDNVEETVRRASARQRREQLGRRLQGRAGTEARSTVARDTVARRADELRGLAEIEAAQKIVLEEPIAEQLLPDAEKRAARQVAGLFTLSAIATAAFLVVYVITSVHTQLRSQNTLLGLTMGLSMLGIGAGLVVWVKKIMPHEEAVQMREELHPTEEERASFDIDFVRGLEESGATRRKVIIGSLGLGTGLLALPPLFLLRDLGPSPTGDTGASLLTFTAWRKDMRLVEMDSLRPLKLGDIEIGGVAAAMPEGHTDSDVQADSSLQLVRLRPDQIQYSAFAGYAKQMNGQFGNKKNQYTADDFVVQGHVAYSRICTHAGCPVTCYMQQRRTFICPCHQSTFQADAAGGVVFGPAAHALPMLPFYVDNQGYFRARGDFPEPVGPSFWERG